MKGGFLQEMARMFFRSAYEKGRREGAGLVPRARLDEAMEMYGKLETEVAEWRKREAKVRAERDEAVAELEAAKARETLFSEERDESSLRKLIEREIGRFYDDEEAETLVGFVPDIIQVSSERAERIRVLLKDLEAARRERDEARARAEKIEAQHKSVSLVFGSESLTTEDACEIYKNFQASLMSKPAAYPWSDEAVERATRTQLEHRVFPGAWDMLKAETKEVFLARMRAALATLAPPPQAATFDVKRLAARAVTVARTGLNCVDVSVLGEKVSSATTMARAEEEAERLRDILVSFTPQAAPVPPVGVGDAVRVEEDRGRLVVRLGSEIVFRLWAYERDEAERKADLLRRGLASLPPLRAVLVAGLEKGGES